MGTLGNITGNISGRKASRDHRADQSKRSLTPLKRTGVVLAASGLLLTGCTPLVAGIEVAPDATNPVCAEAMVAMPETVAGLDRRPTDSQSTAAWGDPASVILRCGVPVPGPTTDHCVEANGVDWVVSEEGENWRITTYGRDPAVEVLFNDQRAGSSSVMVDLAAAVERIPAFGGCTDPGEDVPTVAPSDPAEEDEFPEDGYIPPATNSEDDSQ